MRRTAFSMTGVALALTVLAGGRVAPVQAQATARQGTEGARLVLALENEFWRLTVWPDTGGRIMHAVYKPTGHDWIFEKAGLFCDHVTQQTWPGELMDAKYDFRLLQTGPDQATVRVWRAIDGKGDAAISGVVFERDMTLRRGDPRVHVVIRLRNETNAPRSPTPWVQNIFYVGGGKENNHYFRPTTTGIQEGWTEYSGTQTIRHGADFIREPTAGWTATTNSVNGEGAVFLISYNDLFWLYNCIGNLTTEWWYDPVPLAPGASWETPVTMVPFVGLRSVAYADETVVASLEPAYREEKLSATLSLLSALPEPLPAVSGQLALLTWPAQKTLKIEKFELGEVGSRPTVKTWDLGPLAKTQEAVLRVRLTCGDHQASFEQYFDPLAEEKAQFGQATSNYRLTKPRKVKQFDLPAGARVERHDQPRVLLYHGLHTRYWGLDYAFRYLDVGRVQQSYHTIFVYGDQLDYMVSTPAELLQYDLVVLSSVPAEALTDVGLAFLKLYVEHGGSVLILGGSSAYGAGGYGEGDIAAILPVKPGGSFDRLEIKGGAALTPNGELGERLFPRWPRGDTAPRVYWMHDIAGLQPGAQVVMRAGDRPAIVTAQVGQGRVAAVLLTPWGVPGEGQTGFWEYRLWPRHLAGLMSWLMAQKKESQRQVSPYLLSTCTLRGGLAHVSQAFLLISPHRGCAV